jgi:hypothetical protein
MGEIAPDVGIGEAQVAAVGAGQGEVEVGRVQRQAYLEVAQGDRVRVGERNRQAMALLAGGRVGRP